MEGVKKGRKTCKTYVTNTIRSIESFINENNIGKEDIISIIDRGNELFFIYYS